MKPSNNNRKSILHIDSGSKFYVDFESDVRFASTPQTLRLTTNEFYSELRRAARMNNEHGAVAVGVVVNFSTCQLANLPACQLANLPTCQLANSLEIVAKMRLPAKINPKY